VVRRSFALFFFTKRLAYIVTGFQSAQLGCTKHMTLAIFKTRLAKNRDEMPQQLVRDVELL
jgi:hypothetical protein